METLEDQDNTQLSTESTSDLLLKTDDYFPPWFDTLNCFLLLLAYESLLVIEEYSPALCLGFITLFVCVTIYRQEQHRKENFSAMNRPNDGENHELRTNTTVTEQTTQTKDDSRNKMSKTKFLRYEVLALFLYWLWSPFVRLGIFLYCSREGIVKLMEVFSAASKVAWRGLVIAAGFELSSKLNAPEPVLVTFFNENIQLLWPYARSHFEKFLRTSFQSSLVSRLQLVSGTILPKPGGKDSFQVLSVKIIERSLLNVKGDISLIYCGNYCGIALWPSGEKFRFQSFQMDVKLRFDLRYADLIGPEQRSFMERNNRYIPTFDRAIISLKKINKLDTWDAEENPQETSNDSSKKRYLAGVKDVIQTYFPLDLLMDTSTPEQEQCSSQTLPIRPPEPQLIPDIQNTPISTSMRLGYPEGDATSSVQRVSSHEVLHHTTILTASSSTPQLQRTSKNAPIQVRDINTREKNNGREDNLKYPHLTTRATSNLISSNSESMTVADPELKESTTKDCIVGTGIDPGNTSFGTIQLTTKFQSPRSLIISIHKLRNLPKKKGKTPHPYVKLVLQSQDELELKESTDVLDKTTDPVFEKSFKFQLNKPLSQYTLKVTAKTKHKFTHALGQVILSFTPTSENVEERKWYRLNSPKKEQIPHEVFYNK